MIHNLIMYCLLLCNSCKLFVLLCFYGKRKMMKFIVYYFFIFYIFYSFSILLKIKLSNTE